MIVQMTDSQLTFWRALLAPFAPGELSETQRGGKRLTYVDKRAIENRLDTVCGPHGWFPRYDATARGYKCSLSILIPLADGNWTWLAKEDGAGFEEMGSYNKQTNEWEADVDNDEKSGYTNALRRAAQDAWGIGRYLYNKGIPLWLDPNAKPLAAAPTAPPAPNPRGNAPSQPSPAVAAPSPAQVSAPPPASNGNGKQYDNFKIPKAGKAVFAWAKGLEEHYKTSIINGMKSFAKDQGWETLFGEWTQDQVNAVAGDVISHLKGLDNYGGEFDAVATPSAAPATPTPAPAIGNLGEAKRNLLVEVKALLAKQLGREALQPEVIAAVGNISAETKNGKGHTGEVLVSLKDCNDAAWLGNMLAFTRDQVAKAELVTDDDIPF